MRNSIGSFRGKAVIVASLVLLLAVSVLAGTVYAVTLDGTVFSPLAARIGAEVGDGSYTITVNAAYAEAVAAQSQTVEYYADTSQAATSSQLLANNSSVTFTVDADNSTPTLNLKSSSKVSISSVVVKDAGGNDITADAFGATQYYTDFIESCKTSLFGYLELQNITGNITVDVTYGEPIADKSMGNYNSNLPYFSVTVITKGDVGPYGKAYKNDYEYQNISLGLYSTFNVGDTAPSGSASGGVYNTSGHYTMRDGSQITRYDYSTNTASFDLSYYSYISDIKMYYNDTGEEVKTLNLAGEAYTISRSNSYNSGSTGRSITYVVTYKAFDSTTIYANIQTLQAKAGDYKIRLDADEGGRFTEENNYNISNSNTVLNDMDENINPFNTTSRGYNKVKVINSDSVKFYFDNEQGNSIDFRHFKVYALDVDGNTSGEQIAGEGCDNPLLTLTYSPARDSYDDDGWVTISGLRNYDGDIYVTADTYRYNHNVSIRQSGEHTDSFTITADDAFGAISGAGEGGGADYMKSSYTKSADEGSTTHWMYSGGKYTIKSNGSESLKNVTLTYYPMNGNYGHSSVTTVTYDTKNADGSISFTFPTDSYFSQRTNDCVLTVAYEPITTYEAQMYPTAGGALINSTYASLKLFEVSTYENGASANRMFNTASGVTNTYSSYQFDRNSGTSTNTVYMITPGTTVKVKNLFVGESRSAASTRPQTLIDFINRRLEFKGVKVYKASNFGHNSNSTATLGEELVVTRDGDYYVFTMPSDSGVRIVPEYQDHVRNINILSSEKDNSGKNYRIDQGSLGSASLVAGDDDFVFLYQWAYPSAFNNSYHSINVSDTGYFRKTWAYNRSHTIDGSSFTLTVTPNDSTAYTVKSVKAYKYSYSGGYAKCNNVYGELSAASYDWLTYDGEGNITNEEITGVVGALGDPDANGARSCTVTLPDTLDVGNIVLWVEFAPKDTTTFAHFKYEPDTTSAKSFNPIVNLKSVFTGDYASYASVPATDGADVEAAVYDEDNTQYMNVELGGTNQFRSGFYQYNLVYTIKDYTSGNELAKFRVYRDQIYPVDFTEEQLNEYLVTSACTFEEVSNTDGVCEKATLRFKLPKNGLTLSYQSERLYIPVTVKQYVKDNNGDYQPANNDFTATMTKYFENASGISQEAQNRYFATDSALTGSYGLNTAESSAFADTVTVTGAEETHYMLIENLSSWQGFYIMPNAPAHYMVSNPAIDQKSYNRLDAANSWDGYMTNDTETYVDGSGYRVRYHAENKYGMSYNGEIQSHMGAQRVEISLYYEPTEDYFTQFQYDNGNAEYKPLVTLKGTFQNEMSNTVTMTNSKTTVQTAVYDKDSSDPKLLTVEIGGGGESNSIFHQTNLVYTLTDKTNGEELLKFRIYRGKVEPIEGYTQAQLEQYISSAKVEGYNTNTNSGLLEKATLKIKMPQNGLVMTYTPETSYLPVTVKQYVLDSEGNVTAAGESFTSAVTKYFTGSEELGKKKYFYADTSVTDTYKMWNANESEFVNNYTVTGASDTRYMIFINTYSGLYINPTAPQGYAVATVQGKAFNPAGEEITYEYHKQQWTNIPTDHNNSGYLLTHNYSSYAYLRGATLEVDVYYRPLTTLTIKQEMDGELENGTLATVTMTNTGTLSSPYKAYTDLNSKLVDSVTLTDTKSNVTDTDDDHIGSMFRTSVLGVHQGVLPQIKITPSGARNVSSVKISKKSGEEYVEIPSSAYTVEGDGKTNSYITYTLLDTIAFGDDYLVEIVYGRQQNLTVKAVLRDANGTETVVDSPELYNQSGLDVISVTGQRFSATGEDTDEKAFSDVNNTSEGFDSFNVTTAPHTVNSATNTKVTIDTSFKANSEYVIANVVAYNDNGSVLSLVVPGTKETNGNSGVTYERVTLPSLTSSDNVTVKIILTKVAAVKVNVFTILEDGTSLREGTPDGVNKSDAYVNVAVSSNGVNQKAIITEESEGGYYTGDFDITYDPHSRTVKVLEGSTLEVFAQLPGNGEYVVSKITTNGEGYKNITVSSVSQKNQNLRETLNTNSTTIVSGKEYELNIYLQKARSIYTRVVRDMGDGREEYGNGTVTMRGTHDTEGVIPFTKIVPIPNSAQQPTYYDAQYGSNDYTSEAKAVRGTHVSFEVTPPSQYGIKTVTVKSGTTKDNAVAVDFTSSAPNSSGTVTYTVTEPMSPNNDLFVDVSFAILETATVTVDFQYTDDYEHYYNLFDPTDGLGTMNVRVTDGYYGTPLQVAKNLVTNEEKFSWEGITYSFSDIPNYQFQVAAGNQLSVSSSAYINGRWYEGIQGQCGVFDEQGNRIERLEPTLGQNAGVSRTVWSGEKLVFKIRLAPASTIGAVEVDCNSYNGTPSNARKSDSGSTIINATPPQVSTPIPIPNAMRVWPSGGWTNSNSFGYNGEIMMDSTIDSIDIDKNMVDPGKIKSVILYEFNKGVITDHHYDNPYSDVSPHLHESDEDGFTRKWEFSSANSDNERYYHFIPSGGAITVKSDKSYRAVVLYDLITVYSYTNYGGYVKQYLYYGSKEPKDINMSGENSADYTVLTGSNRFADNTVNQKTKAYYVLVSDLPKEDLSLNSATFEDYIEGAGTVDIKQALLDSYTTRTHNGITKYYYFYEINKDDAYPVDNSMRLYSYFTMRRDDPPAIEESLDCDIAVEQWNRDTYDGNYVAASNQSAEFSVETGKVLKLGNKAGADQNPITITTATGSMYSNRKQVLTIKPTPADGYNVEKVVITDYGTGTYYLDSNGELQHTLGSSDVTIKIYYSRPLLRISSTNEGNQGKATVDVYNRTTETMETVLTENKFTNGTFVTKGNDAEVIIKPLTYEDGGKDYYYSVASIRIGDAYNNTLTAYTEDGGDVAGDAFTIEKMADGSQYKLTINNMTKDKYVFIQLVGKEKIYISNLQVNQQIKLAGSSDYVDCFEGCFGSVTVNGTLSGNDAPLNFDGTDRASLTFDDRASVEGTVLRNTTLSLSDIVAPEGYIVKSVEVVMNGASAGVTESDGTYTLNNTAPDSGTTVITVKYALPTVPYTLNYHYQGRKSGNTNGSYTGDEAESDAKTYTVNVELYPAELTENNLPTVKALAKYAPAVDDLYKNCVWNLTDTSLVEYDTQSHTVDVTAEQTARTYHVEFHYDNKTQAVESVTHNALVKDNEGRFIQAPATDGTSGFAYWKVEENGKEIAQCYSRDFNLRVTGNYTVTAMYTGLANVLSISDPRFTRQQYTSGENTVDRLQMDFLLAYMQSEGLLLNSDTATQQGYKSGVVLEYFDDCTLKKENISGATLTEDDKLAVTLPGVDENSLKALITDTANSAVNGNQHLLQYTVPNSYYNNKNRVDRAITFNNREDLRLYVYRAYYYVAHTDGGNTVIELSAPVTFYLYDIGNSEQNTTEEG